MKKTIMLAVLLLAIPITVNAAISLENPGIEQECALIIVNELEQTGFVQVMGKIAENEYHSIYLFPVEKQSTAAIMARLLYGGNWIQEANGEIRRPNLDDFKKQIITIQAAGEILGRTLAPAVFSATRTKPFLRHFGGGVFATALVGANQTKVVREFVRNAPQIKARGFLNAKLNSTKIAVRGNE